MVYGIARRVAYFSFAILANLCLNFSYCTKVAFATNVDDFLDYCLTNTEEGSALDYTVSYLLSAARKNDCLDAYDVLRTKKYLFFPSDNRITDLRPLIGLDGLKYLDLSNTGVTDLKPLSSQKNLGSLKIDETRVVDLSPLKKMKNLGYLSVSIGALRDVSELCEIRQLGTVILVGYENELSNIRCLASMNLRYLDIRGTVISSEDLNFLWTHMPNCEIWPRKIDQFPALATMYNIYSDLRRVATNWYLRWRIPGNL